MTIGAVVVTYNSAAWLRPCLLSLWAEGVSEVVVVDNASTDASVAVASGLGVRVQRLPRNVGFAAACNIGARQLSGETVLFLNPDAQLERGALRRALGLVRRPGVGAVGLLLHDADGVVEGASFGQPVNLVRLLYRRWRPIELGRTPVQLGWVSGGALLVRREAWQEVNGFDSDYFLYWEDVDLCERLRRAGWQVWLHPQARVEHARGASLADGVLRTAWYDASADRFFRKTYATPIWLAQRMLRRGWRLVSPRVPL